MKIVVVNHVTLDGVMQAPGLPEKGFAHGGWGAERNGDQAVMSARGLQLSASSGWLRR